MISSIAKLLCVYCVCVEVLLCCTSQFSDHFSVFRDDNFIQTKVRIEENVVADRVNTFRMLLVPFKPRKVSNKIHYGWPLNTPCNRIRVWVFEEGPGNFFLRPLLEINIWNWYPKNGLVTRNKVNLRREYNFIYIRLLIVAQYEKIKSNALKRT